MTPYRLTFRERPSQRLATGFTLIELLIVVALLMVLTTLTLALFNSTGESDRIRSSARQLQSALLGARDRAIRAKAPRGLRLIVEPAPLLTITSMVYLGVPEIWRQGTIQVGRADFPPFGTADQSADPGGVIIVRGWGTDWRLLFQQGLLVTGSRIKIPADANGSWYTVDTQFLASPPTAASGDPNPPDDILRLTTEFRTPATYPSPLVAAFDPLLPNDLGQGNYLLELEPAVLPGQEPLKLSSGIVIDAARSQLPTTMVPPNLDIMFSPRGLVASGSVLASGLVHFYLCTQEDAELNFGVIGTASINDPSLNGPRDPADPQSGEKLILTLFPQTGNVATFPVDTTDTVNNLTRAAPKDLLADDPFRNAKIGGTAGR